MAEAYSFGDGTAPARPATGHWAPRSASTPQLPALHATHHGTQARAPPRDAGALRQVFLAGLLNEDLQSLTKWHGSRPHHEQKRFLRSVDSLYKAFDATAAGKTKVHRPAEPDRAEVHRAAMEAAHAQAAAAARAAEQDPLSGPPRDTPRGNFAPRGEVMAAPAQPIEVFEQRKREGLRRRRTGNEDPNSLVAWLEGESVTSQTTASTAVSQRTRFSELTATSMGGSSICSEPGTMHQAQFRAHKRAFAINRNNWTAVNQHEASYLKDGVPHYGFPDSERMLTSFKAQFGSRGAGTTITPNMYENLLKDGQGAFVSRFLETAPPEQREQFQGMVRSLQNLRMLPVREKRSVIKNEFDLEENSRLWKPARQRPIFETCEINNSQVPLGNLTVVKTHKFVPPPAPLMPTFEHPPPSPSVSGLGSLPLTRLNTPMTVFGDY